MTNSTATAPTSPLLALPAEIRVQIYTLLFTPSIIPYFRKISTRNICSDYILPPLHLPVSLLRTCHQIHHECLPILYGCNKFGAHHSLLTGLPFLVKGSRPVTHGPGKQLIKRWYLNVRLDTDPGFDREKATRAFSGAEELEIEVFQAMFNSSDFSVLKLFEGVRGVDKVKIGGSVGNGRYARWLEKVMMAREGEDVGSFEDEMDEVAAASTLHGVVFDNGWHVWRGNR